MKTKKLTNVKRKTLKGGFWWSTKKDYLDDIIENIFYILNPLKTVTNFDKKNMRKFKKLLFNQYIINEFIGDYEKLHLTNRISNKDINNLISTLNDYNFIVYPQIELMTRSEEHEFKNYDEELDPYDILREYKGGFWWNKNISDEILIRTDQRNEIRQKYLIPYQILQKLCHKQPINFKKNLYFLKNVKHFKQIMNSKITNNYELLHKSNLNRDAITNFLLENRYSVHYTIDIVDSSDILERHINEI